jgi:hypothetical protein
MNPTIETLTATERTDLMAGLRMREQRETTSDATLVGSLFETQLRILNRHADAEQVRTIVRNLLGE